MFDAFTSREKALEQRRKNVGLTAVRGRAMNIAREIISLKGQITLKEMEKRAKRERTHVPETHKKLFDDTLAEELKDFLMSYFTN